MDGASVCAWGYSKKLVNPLLTWREGTSSILFVLALFSLSRVLTCSFSNSRCLSLECLIFWKVKFKSFISFMKVRTTCLYLKRRKTSCTVYNLQRPSVRVSHLFLIQLCSFFPSKMTLMNILQSLHTSWHFFEVCPSRSRAPELSYKILLL